MNFQLNGSTILSTTGQELGFVICEDIASEHPYTACIGDNIAYGATPEKAAKSAVEKRFSNVIELRP